MLLHGRRRPEARPAAAVYRRRAQGHHLRRRHLLQGAGVLSLHWRRHRGPRWLTHDHGEFGVCVPRRYPQPRPALHALCRCPGRVVLGHCSRQRRHRLLHLVGIRALILVGGRWVGGIGGRWAVGGGRWAVGGGRWVGGIGGRWV